MRRSQPEQTDAAPAGEPSRVANPVVHVGNAAMARLLQRSADSPATSAAPPDFADRLSRTGSGQAIPADVRENLETGLGTPLADVRLHTDANAANLASEVSAQAFTVGSDIYFGRGKYEPHSDSGYHLLAHEVTHTVQQQGAGSGGSLTVSQPHDPAEREADRVAGQLSSGRAPDADTAQSTATSVQRFSSHEHLQIGNAAATGQTTTLRYGEDPAEVLTFGEVIALSGDYFGSLAEMEQLAATPAGRLELKYARWYALRQGSEPAVDGSVKQAVKNRYFNLAARNVSHFSAGGDAAPTYQDGHRMALRRAFLAGMHGNAEEMRAAMTAEAAAQHYLTDMFSGGHVRTPRREIQQWYQSNFGDSPARIKRLLVDRLVQHLNDIDSAQLWYIPDGFIRDEVSKIVEDLGGPAIRSFSLGDIVSLALHNYDNAQGVQVTSAVNAAGAPDSGTWRAFGDNNLNRPEAATTLNMVVAAARTSIREVERAQQLGRARGAGSGGPADEAVADAGIAAITPFAALAYVPRATQANVPITGAATDANAHELAWHWGSFTKLTYDAVDATVSGEIAGTVSNLKVGDANGIIRKDKGWPIGVLELHAQQAVQRIALDLRQRGIAVIIEAIGRDPGAANTAPRLPQDAGLPGGVP